jgi:uncharacterized protein (TIGR03086 family)
MTDVDLLSGVLAKTEGIVAGVRDDQLGLPTPCSEYDVEALRSHIVGWLQVFSTAAQMVPYEGDAAKYRCGDDPVGEFRTAADGLIAGIEQHGIDRQVSFAGSEMPGRQMFDMALMEYLQHGWDLAVATGQPIPYTEREAAPALAAAEATLLPQYRGDGGFFGHAVPVGDDASTVERLVAFLGRDPAPMRAG